MNPWRSLGMQVEGEMSLQPNPVDTAGFAQPPRGVSLNMDSNETPADGFSDGVRAIIDLEFVKNGLQAFLDGDLAAIHGDANFTIGGAFACSQQDLEVVGTEVGVAHGFFPCQSAEIL